MSDQPRRRLEPLRLDTPHEESQPKTPEASAAPRAATSKRPTHVVAAVACACIGAGATMLLTRPRAQVASAVSASAPIAPPPNPQARDSPPHEWTSDLHTHTCDAPCCGGSTCEVTPANQANRSCRVGSKNCDPCASGTTCIPGECETLFDGDEKWSLRLSAIVQLAPDRRVIDPCESGRDLWLCVSSRPHPKALCISQVEACKHGTQGVAEVSVTTEDLVSTGIKLQVREGGPDGRVLATKADARYPGGIRRMALCNGVRMNFPSGAPVSYVTFFLEPSL